MRLIGIEVDLSITAMPGGGVPDSQPMHPSLMLSTEDCPLRCEPLFRIRDFYRSYYSRIPAD